MRTFGATKTYVFLSLKRKLLVYAFVKNDTCCQIFVISHMSTIKNQLSQNIHLSHNDGIYQFIL